MKTKTIAIIIISILLILPLNTIAAVQAESLFDARGVSLFKDHRARMVGDILTIIIIESTSASSKGKSKFPLGKMLALAIDGIINQSIIITVGRS